MASVHDLVIQTWRSDNHCPVTCGKLDKKVKIPGKPLSYWLYSGSILGCQEPGFNNQGPTSPENPGGAGPIIQSQKKLRVERKKSKFLEKLRFWPQTWSWTNADFWTGWMNSSPFACRKSYQVLFLSPSGRTISIVSPLSSGFLLPGAAFFFLMCCLWFAETAPQKWITCTKPSHKFGDTFSFNLFLFTFLTLFIVE